jgi:uncharacterized membrane protein
VSDLSLATSRGLPLLSLAFHVGMGLAALAAGFVAIAARKGGKWHRKSGMVFVYTMIATGITAAGISLYEGKSAGGGIVTVYFVFTAFTAVKPLPTGGRLVDIALMVLAFTLAVAGFAVAYTAFGRPGNQINGVPAGMTLFLSTINMLAAIGDFRMIRAGGIQGTRRIARHLWRMCFGLFIANGSFVGQLATMKFLPEPFRNVLTVVFLAATPLVVLLYWMWRVRIRQNLRGVVTAKIPPAEKLNVRPRPQTALEAVK